MSTNSNVDVYIRVSCPGAGKQTNPFDTSGSIHIGHYDLVIDETLTFNGHFGIPALDASGSNRIAFEKPTFSWGTNSRLDITPLLNATNRDMFDSHYKWKFTTTQNKIEELLTAFDATVDSSTLETPLNGGVEHANKISYQPSAASGFQNYRITDKNCFVAVSVWMEKLGIISIQDIVSAAQSRRMYTRVLELQIGAFYGWTEV